MNNTSIAHSVLIVILAIVMIWLNGVHERHITKIESYLTNHHGFDAKKDLGFYKMDDFKEGM